VKINKHIKRILKSYQYPLGYNITRIDGKKFKCDIHHSGHWRAIKQNRWEPETFEIISKFADNDATYCDIGAWIGATVLHGALKYKKVYCFEPDPIAYKHLLFNLHMNKIKNVLPFNIALGPTDGTIKIASFGEELGDSMSSMINDNKENSVEVPSLRWQTALDLFGLEKIGLIKIDIEGGEFDLIPDMKDYLLKHKPAIYLSLHAPFLKEQQRQQKVKKLVEVLSIYKKCYDNSFREVGIDNILKPSVYGQPVEFIFAD